MAALRRAASRFLPHPRPQLSRPGTTSRLVAGLAVAMCVLGCASEMERPRNAGPRWDSTNALPQSPQWSRGIWGELRLVIDEAGVVGDSIGQVWAYSPGDPKEPEFQNALLGTVKSWRFDPARRDGAPVADTLLLQLASEGNEDFARAGLTWDYRGGSERDTLWARWMVTDSTAMPSSSEGLDARREVLTALMSADVIARRDRFCLLPLGKQGGLDGDAAETKQVGQLAARLGLVVPQTDGCLGRSERLLLLGRLFQLGPGRIRMRVAVEPTAPRSIDAVADVRRLDCEVHLGEPSETRCVEVRGVPSTNRNRIAGYVRAYPGAW
jgi:hypothetical protein